MEGRDGEKDLVRGRSEDGEEGRPSKLARVGSGGASQAMDVDGADKGGSGGEDNGGKSGSPARAGSDGDGGEGAEASGSPPSDSGANAAPTRRSLRPRKPSSVVKASSSKADKKDKDSAAGENQNGKRGGDRSNGSGGSDEKGAGASKKGASPPAERKKGAAAGQQDDALPAAGSQLQYGGFPLDADTMRAAKPGTTLRVTIQREYLSSSNRQVRARQLWGTDIYTEDSDVVAVLIHQGYLNLLLIDSVASDLSSVDVGIKIHKAQPSYASTNSNNIRSRSWNGATGAEDEARCSYSVVSCCATLVTGEELKMFPAAEAFAIIPPTFVPAATERVVNTRSSASSTERKNRFKQEVTLQYNLCNEPWLKYVMASVADQGLAPSKRTSARLHGEVIYAESQTTRYELSMREREEEKSATGDNGAQEEKEEKEEKADLFRWSKCESICTLSEMRKVGIPFPDSGVTVLEDNVEWEHFKWGPSGVHIHGTFYPLSRIHFMQKQEPAT